MAGRGIVGAGGGLGTGLLLLVGGLIVKHSQANLVAECSSGLGQLGQALDPNAATGCSGAQTLSSLATVAIWLGAIMLGFAVIGGIAMLAAAGVFVAQQKPKTATAGTTSVRRAEPGTGTGASPSAGSLSARSPSGASPAPASIAATPPPGDAPTATPPITANALTPPSANADPVTAPPASAVTAPSADAPPAGANAGPQPGPACQDCGRELRPGARFCPVCGHPVADNGARASA
jgi:zinc-ribbon domain